MASDGRLLASGSATLDTAQDTEALGAHLAAALRCGDVVVLSGPLGAGKTVLTKGIARGLDVDGPVTSPTYVLARVHPARRSGAPALVHVDVYRLLDHDAVDLLGELDSLDLDTDLDDAVVVVEWGDAVRNALPDDRLEIGISTAVDGPADGTVADTLRFYELDAQGRSWAGRAERLDAALERWTVPC